MVKKKQQEKRRKKKLAPLVPPDLERCEAERSAGHTFMTLGGRVGQMVRCDSKPIIVVTEVSPGKDGRRGSMSLCGECLNVLLAQPGAWNFTLRTLARYRKLGPKA